MVPSMPQSLTYKVETEVEPGSKTWPWVQTFNSQSSSSWEKAKNPVVPDFVHGIFGNLLTERTSEVWL